MNYRNMNSMSFLALCVLASLIYYASAVQSYPPEDMEESCAHKVFLDECEEDPDYMLVHCAKECEEWSEEMDDHNLDNITSFYDLSANDIDGNNISFDQFRGKVSVFF